MGQWHPIKRRLLTCESSPYRAAFGLPLPIPPFCRQRQNWLQDVEVVLYDGLGDLPHFNPDLDGVTVSPAVSVWRSKLRDADGVAFSVPEYAHGVPGVLKNSLDWVVGSGELVDKPVTLFNASPRGTYGQASLTETLTVMSAKVVPEASVTLQLPGKPVAASQIVADPGMAAVVRAALAVFAGAIETVKAAR